MSAFHAAIAVIFTAILAIAPARADPSAQESLDARSDVTTPVYVTGIYVGFTWANARLSQNRQPQLFCAPVHGALQYDQLMDIMSSFINSGHRAIAAQPVGAALLLALEDAYPCSPH